MIAPDLGQPVPAFHQLVVNQFAGRGDLAQIVKRLREHARVEHALGVGHGFGA